MGRALVRFAVTLLLAVAGASQAADLSPGRWPPSLRAELQAKQVAFAPKATRAFEGRVLVTGDASPIALHAGLEALRQGGSAADAASVTALTQIATTLGGTVSYAGILELAYFDASSRKVSFLDGGWGAYAGERDPRSIPDLGATPPTDALGRQTLTPGFMRGLEALHSRFGRLPWATLFEPAIWYAENGVTASAAILGFRRANEARFARTAEGRAFIAMPDGKSVQIGDLIRQPDLARTLRAVAQHGAQEMYQGHWARAYVDAVHAYGGHAAMADLQRYRPRWREPITTDFAGATVFAMSGGPLACATLNALSLIEATPAAQRTPYWTDPATFRAYARAIQYATLRQYLVQGATAFERKVGLDGAKCADRIARPYAARVAGELQKIEPRPFGDDGSVQPAAGHDTMAVVVVDRRGDVAVLVHSSNGEPTGIVVGGIPIPESATVNKAELSHLQAGDLVPNLISTVIALRGGRPVAGVGATATSLMPETVRLMGQTLSGVDFVALTGAPPLLYNFSPPKRGDSFGAWPVLVPEGAYDPAFRSALEAMGVTLKDVPRASAWGSLRGAASAVKIDPSTGIAGAVETPILANFVETGP